MNNMNNMNNNGNNKKPVYIVKLEEPETVSDVEMDEELEIFLDQIDAEFQYHKLLEQINKNK